MASRRTTLLSGGVALALLTSCAPTAATPQGREINELYDIFFWIAAAVFVVTAGLIGWSIVRYRAKPGAEELPKQLQHNLKLEITWFAIPQAIVVVLFALSAFTLADINEQVPEPVAVVEVVGYQWGWRFTYEGTNVEVVGTPQEPAEVVMPTGNVALRLTSADVVHAFYIPKFLMKRDAIPGRVTRMDLALEEGTYDGACAEFCGLLHHRMPFTIEVVTPEEFESWLSDASSDI
ncbi:MAG: cytochrome c oxidase subunit II [Actinomycetota bacterium]|nr:cytochrome c oxidase subunit II [Actinomycetota bacterium]